jgi:Transposase DDE domain group 1
VQSRTCFADNAGAPATGDRRSARQSPAIIHVPSASSPEAVSAAGRGCGFYCAPIGAFAREELMAWCEANCVDHVFGLARNDRVAKAIEAEMSEAAADCQATGRPKRRFKDLLWSRLDSWSPRRRTIGKAEALPPGDNPRLIVTSLTPAEAGARVLYEQVYCGRGEMGN